MFRLNAKIQLKKADSERIAKRTVYLGHEIT